MVLGELGQRLTSALRSMNSAMVVDEEVIDQLLKDIGNALISADVGVMLVAKLRKRLKRRLALEDQQAGTNMRRLAHRAVFEELCELLDPGIDPFKPQRGRSNVIMFVGLQGAGKTTTVTKLANYYARKKWSVGVVCADTFRAGAFDQIKQNCHKARIPYYGSYTEGDPVVVAETGVAKFRDEGCEIIIVDTSGRHKQEDALFEEMEQVHAVVQPDDVVFVLDSSIGQAAEAQALAFKQSVAVGSVVITKMDGHAKGGGALSAVAATESPIIFIGTGEHIDELEPFEAQSFVQRLLGLGDMKGLMNKIQEAGLDQNTDLYDKLQQGIFTLRDLYEQFQNVMKMGPLSQVMSMLPGMSNMIPKGKEKEGTERINKFLTCMDSMTADELDCEVKFVSSRVARIARGAGVSSAFVNELLQEHKRFAKIVKKMKKMKMGKNGAMDMNQMSKLMTPQMMQQMGGQKGLKSMMQQFSSMMGGGGGGFPGFPGM